MSDPRSLRRHYPSQVQAVGVFQTPSQPGVTELPLQNKCRTGRLSVNPGITASLSDDHNPGFAAQQSNRRNHDDGVVAAEAKGVRYRRSRLPGADLSHDVMERDLGVLVGQPDIPGKLPAANSLDDHRGLD
jgi:hypothetical protein